MTAPSPIRVLALDRTSRGFGFVVFEGSTLLLDWGVKSIKPDTKANRIAKLSDLIKRYLPAVIVFEDFRQTKSPSNARARRFIKCAGEAASKFNISTRCFAREKLRKAFSLPESSTKHDIAQSIAERSSELAPLLPRVRRLGSNEDYRMHIFDAASLAFAFFHSQERRRNHANDDRP